MAIQKSALAHMADTGSARPSHRNVTCLGQFQQTFEFVIPWHIEATSSEGYDWSVPRGAKRGMRNLCLCPRDTWFNTAQRSEYFLMYRVWWNTQRNQIAIHIYEKSRRSAQIEIRLDGETKFLQACDIKMSVDVKVSAERTSGTWLAIRDRRMTSGNRVIGASGLRLKRPAPSHYARRESTTPLEKIWGRQMQERTA